MGNKRPPAGASVNAANGFLESDDAFFRYSTRAVPKYPGKLR